MKPLNPLRFAAHLLSLLLFAVSLHAAPVTTQYVILFDVDNSTSTGCTYTSGTTSIAGIEQVLTTTVSRDGSTAAVTKVERQQCTGGVLTTPALVVDATGWPALISSSDGTLHIVTHIPNSAFGGTVPMNMRLYFGVIETGGASFIEHTPDGSAILYPTIGPRHRAVVHDGIPEEPRPTVLDGSYLMFDGLPSMFLGAPITTGSPLQLLSNAFGLSGATDLLFLIDIGGSPLTGAITAVNDTYTVQQGHAIGAGAPGVLSNDINTTGAALFAQLMQTVHLGTLQLHADGGFSYHNNGAPQTTDTFTYTANAAGKTSNPATVTFHITPDNAPVAVNDAYSVAHGGTLAVPPPGVLFNDSDADHDPLTAVIDIPPAHASTFLLNPNGSFVYHHDGSNTLSDTFKYRATDQIVPSFPATVTITIGPDAPPVAVADSYSVAEGGTLSVPAPGLFANDSDPDTPQSSWTVQIVTGPAHGILTPGTGGAFTYVHDDSSTAPDSFTYKISDGILTSNTATVSITVVCPTISVTNPATTTGTAAAAFSQTFTQSGANATATFTTTSTLPTGLTLSSAGVLSGTPTQTGTFPIVVKVAETNTSCFGTSTTYTLVIGCQTINVINPGTSTGVAAAAFSQTFTQSGAIGATTFSTSSTLPAGLTLSSAGVLSGTPTQTGTFPIVVTVTDSNGCLGTGATYTLTITCQTINVTDPATTTGTANAAFSQTFTQSGSIGTATFSTASALPAGLTLSTGGVLSGTPLVVGSFPIVVTVTDSNGCTGSGATYTLVIGCQVISVTNPVTTTGTAASAFSQTFTAGNTIGTVTFTTASPLPTGLSLSTAGVLSGTPTQTGSFPIVVTATDANSCSGSGSTYTLVIGCQTISVTNPANTTGTVSAPFSEQFNQSGAIGTATFTTASALPSGLTLSTSGLLSGTPLVIGSFPIVVTVTDSNSCTGTSATYTLVIGCQTITVTNPVTNSDPAGTPFSVNFTQSGAVGGATFTTASTLPTGLSLSTGGVLSGTPTQGGTFPIVVTVTDGNGCTGTGATYNLTIVCPVISVTNPGTSSGTVNVAFSQTFTQSGGIGTTTFSTASTLPAGLSLSSGGVLSGTPTQSGPFPIVVTATDSNGCTGSGATYNLVIACQVIPVTNPVTNTGTVNVAFSQTFSASNTIGTVTFTTSSTLPAGLSLATNGTLSGTPTQTGPFSIVVTATDANSCSGSGATYTLTIGCQVISVTNPVTTTGTAAAAFSQTFSASNTIGTVTFTTASPLPTGLSLSTAGVLSGTPTQTGSFPIVVTATDANGCSGNGATYTLVIGCQTISVTNPANTTGTVSAPFSEQFNQSGAIGTATFTTASALPSGLTLSTSGLLSGTPLVIGSFPIVVTVTDSNSCTGTSATYTLVIGCQTITVTNPVTNSDPAGTPFSVNFTQSGAVGGATFTTASTLPTGLSLSTGGVLSGTPTQGGTFPIVVTVTDGNGCTGTGATYNLTIVCPVISVTNPGTSSGTVNVAFSQTFTQSGGIGTTTFSTASTLPTGLSLSSGGVLSGTPTQSGPFPIVVTATDSNGCTGSGATYNLVIACQVIPVTNPVTNTGTVNVAFSQTFSASNTIGTVTFTTASTLPAGLSLATNGTLSGTPTQTGPFSIVVTATDANSCSGTSSAYSLTIGCQVISVTNPVTTTGTAAAAFSQTFSASNTIGTVTFTTVSPLPTGLSLSTGGVLSGTPTQTGSFPIVVTATDANSCSGSGSTYTLVIGCQTINVTNPANTTGTVSAPFSEQFNQSGAIGTATFTTASTLPNGLTLSTAGLLSGTPTQSGTFPIVVTVTDSNSCTGTSATYTLVINCQVITVTNPSSNTDAAGTALTAANFTFTQSGAVGGATFTTASTLPTGVTLTTGGVLTGTPVQGGSFPITVTVTDGNGCTGTSSGYTLTITCPVITVTNPGTSSGTVNIAFSQTFTQSGGVGTTTFSTASALPTGLSLSSGGVLSGTPTQNGTFPIVVTATDSNGCTGSGSTYTLVIACQVIPVTNPVTTTGTVDAAFSQTFTSSNTIGTVTYTTASTLPAGLTLATNGNLSGTPTVKGTFPIVVTATDANGCSGNSSTYTLVINCQTITVTNPVTNTGTVDAAFSQTFTQSAAHGTATFTTASTLPAGLSLSTGGVLSGTPTQKGLFPIVVTVTDSNGCTGTGSTYTLTINCQTITVTKPVPNSGTVNAAFSQTFTQSGAHATATFTTASTLPNGLTLSTAGVLAGTPTQPGTFPIVVTVTDANGCTGTSSTYTLVIACQTISVTNPATTTGTVASAFSQTFLQSGGFGTTNFTTTSTLPTGLTLHAATGVLDGTPTQSGSFPIVVRATDSNGCFGDGATYTLVISCNVITVTNPATTTGTAGTLFSQTFTQSGGNGTITWSETGALPPGITLNTSNGLLSGTTSTTGSFPITVTATDGNSCQGTGATYTLVISCQTINITNATLNSVQAGTALTPASSWTFSATGILGTAAWSETGALPTGITFSSTGVLSGTTNQIGSFPITVKVTDTNLCFGTSSYTLTVTCPTITVTRTGGGTTMTQGTYNTAGYSDSVTATGGSGSYTYALHTGSLPAGLSLSSAGAITGTPTATGTFTFTIRATDGSTSCTGDTVTLTLKVGPKVITETYATCSSCGTAGTTDSVGNTQAVAAGFSTPTTPFVSYTNGALFNDTSDATMTVTTASVTNAAGTITFNTSGGWSYVPAVGFTGTASFNYNVTSNGVSTQSTINIAVSNKVWYVDNTGSNGNGTSTSPFNVLTGATSAASASGTGDIIYVSTGVATYNTATATTGLTLKTNQQLIGAGFALLVNGNTLAAAGTKPQITNATAASDAITLAAGNTVEGLTITGTAGARDGIRGTSVADFTANTLTISGNVSSGVHFISMTGTVTMTNTTFSSNGEGVTVGVVGGVAGDGGTAAITIGSTNSIAAGVGQRSVSVQDRAASAGAITINAVITDSAVGSTGISIVNNNANPGSTISFGGNITLTSGGNQAVTLTTNTNATINFSGNLAITTTTGSGFSASGGGTLNVTGTTATITTGAAAAGLSLNGITIGSGIGNGVTFSTVNTTGATTAINLVNFAAAGTVAVNGGTITNGAGTTGISLQGTNTSLTLASVTITGGSGATVGITNSTNFGTLTIGSSVSVSAATALNLTTGTLTGTFSNVTASAGSVLFNGVTFSGTTGAAAGGITGVAGNPAFSLTGGSGTLTWAPPISQSLANTAVTISGSAASVTFSGNLTAGGTSTGVSIATSSGSYNFSGTTNGITGSGGGVTINGETGSGTITFSAGTTINPSAAVAALTLTNNSNTTAVNFNGNITQAQAANAVTVSTTDKTTLTFAGNVTSSGTSTGLSIAGSSGTYNFNGTTNTFSGAGGITIGAGGESGTITFSSGTTITTAGTAFLVDGTTGNVTAAITYSGTINKASTGILISVNKLINPGTLTMTHSPAATGNLTQSGAGANNGISITNSTSTNITIANASVTVNNGAPAFTGSGNTGATINLQGIAFAANGNKVGMLISGAGTINITAGVANSSINSSGGSAAAIDGTTTAYTGTLNLTGVSITDAAGGGVFLTSSTLGGSGSTISGSGSGLTLSSVALTNGAGMTSVSSSAGANGISLTSCTGGTYTVSGGTITGNSGSSFLVSGGSATFTYNGTLAQSNAQRIVNVSGITGGTLTLAGGITGSTSCTGITAGGSAGTVTMSGAISLNGVVDTFTASGSGTFTIVASNTTNTIGSTTNVNPGPAVSISSATIGASGVKFQSIKSNAGVNGIALSNTGASGSFSLLASGGTCSTSANCTGGFITNATGAGITMTNTLSPSFDRIFIQSTQKSGISGTQVQNFTLTNSTIDSSGLDHNAVTAVDDSNVSFGFGTLGTEKNVYGTVIITGNTLTNSWQHGIFIQNYDGTIADAQIQNNTITSSNVIANSNGSGIQLLGNGSTTTVSGVTKAEITGNTINNFPSGAGITAQFGNPNGSNGTWGTPGTANAILIQSNKITGDATNKMNTNGILGTMTGNGNAYWKIDSNGTVANPLTNMKGAAIGITTRATSAVTSNTQADITNNVIVAHNVLGSQGIAVGIVDVTTNTTDAPQLSANIIGNTISQTSGQGIDALATNCSGLLKLKIQNNNVSAPAQASTFAIEPRQGGTAGGGAPAICLNISGNTATGNATTGIGIRKQSGQTWAYGVDSLPGGDTATPNFEAYINGLNPAANGTTLVSATSGFSTCSNP